MTRVLLVGSGAREHAMAAALRRNPSCELFVACKHRNPGLMRLAKAHKILDDRDVAGIVAWAKEQKVELAVIGPETPLEAGVSDALAKAGIKVASPSQAAARIETSKSFMRDLMARHKVPGRLAHHPFNDAASALKFLDRAGPVWAVKPTGLTGGKGVQVHGEHFTDVAGAKAYVRSIFDGSSAGGAVQFEELARGEEYTLMAFCDGATIAPMPAVQDHKRLHEGDVGPNTGGMGSYSQADGLLPFLARTEYEESVRIVQAIVDALRRDGTPYVGTIYGQFMLTTSGPKVIEVNARFGDPEAMNVLHLLESDYLTILQAMAAGKLGSTKVKFRRRATVVKYVVPQGYGEGKPAPHEIRLDEGAIHDVGAEVFYGSVEPAGPFFTTLGSRALAVLGEGATIADANESCEEALAFVHGDGLHARHDIGTPELIERRVRHLQELRGDAGPAARSRNLAQTARTAPRRVASKEASRKAGKKRVIRREKEPARRNPRSVAKGTRRPMRRSVKVPVRKATGQRRRPRVR